MKAKDQTQAPTCASCFSREHSVFRNLESGQLEQMTYAKSCSTFKKGQALFTEGQHPTGVFCIHKGKLKLFKLGSSGKEQIIRFAKEGDMIGYRSLLSGELFSATAEAMEEAQICFIPKDTLFQMLQVNPKLSFEMMKLACHELGEASKVITNLAQKPVRERLAEILLILKHTFGEDKEGYIDVSLTREEISNMTGTATESAIRLLSEFKADELILLDGKRIKILNAKKLAKIGMVEEEV